MQATIEAPAPHDHNNPPPDTPLEAAERAIDDLYGEARLWLDGAAVENQDHADGLARLLDEARKAEKQADKAREVEKAPHLAASRSVDASYKPLLERAKRMQDGLKAALAPWLRKLDEDVRAKADAARREAEERARVAAEAMRAADSANLAEREAAEQAVTEAKRAETAAKQAEGARAHAAGGGRATALRSHWTWELTDLSAAIRHYWTTDPDAFAGLVKKLANGDLRSGKRTIPGFTVTEERRVV